MRMTDTRPNVAGGWSVRAREEISNLLSLLAFFAVTALLFRSVGFAVMVTAALGFHELGHAAALGRLGLPWRICFGLPGAWTWSPLRDRARLPQFTNAAIHMAGPFFSLLLTVIALALHNVWQPESPHLLILANFSAQVGFLNLMPLGSMTDGGKVIRRAVASLDERHRGLAAVLPVAITVVMVLLYALAEFPHTIAAQTVPGMHAPQPQNAMLILLGLLLVGVWIAAGVLLEVSSGAGGKDPLAAGKPMKPKEGYFLILVMWNMLMMLLFLIAATPFWLQPEYVMGSVWNVVDLLRFIVAL